MRDMGPVQQFLGMNIQRDRVRRVLSLHQAKHIDELLERFGMVTEPAHTPLPHQCVLRAGVDDKDRLPAQFPYRALVGLLLYIAMWTRPDIAFAVSQVARFQMAPTTHHWDCAKHIVRYIKGTRDLGLTYSATNASGVKHDKPVLRGYVDASWGEDLEGRQSQSGYVFTMGNAAISWRSKLQRVPALSSTEAEYVALSSGVCERLCSCATCWVTCCRTTASSLSPSSRTTRAPSSRPPICSPRTV